MLGGFLVWGMVIDPVLRHQKVHLEPFAIDRKSHLKFQAIQCNTPALHNRDAYNAGTLRMLPILGVPGFLYGRSSQIRGMVLKVPSVNILICAVDILGLRLSALLVARAAP